MNYKLALKRVNSHFFIDLPVKQVTNFKKLIDNLELTLDTIAAPNSHLILVPGNLSIKSRTGILMILQPQKLQRSNLLLHNIGSLRSSMNQHMF